MRNPLIKRLPRELKGDIGKYLVIFLFMTMLISLVSGFLVADNSVYDAYEKGFEKYNVEYADFVTADEMSDETIKELENDNKVRIYDQRYYKLKESKRNATIRVYGERKEVNKLCIMSGRLAKADDEITLDRVFAKNNDYKVGDNIKIGDKDYKITGFVAMPDYSCLFEDNAEFGYGMLLAQRAIRDGLKAKVEAVVADGKDEAVKEAGQEWLDTFAVGATNGAATDKLIAALEACGCDAAKEILAQKNYLSKKSQWIFGGDGWAYDIGFGGVDHVLASGRDINVMVFDTEVYSNTGGQSSKSTPTGAIAQFAAGGKETKKKDMASIAMSYGYVYVAQISMGADFNQTVKAIAEAEAYPGPSLIIAYAPCINHGIKKGMAKAQTEEELAVKCGYWHNFRFNPAADKKFALDSKTPDMENYMDFLNGEVRYNSLQRQNPEKAARLFAKNQSEAKARYEYLQKLITLYGTEE